MGLQTRRTAGDLILPLMGIFSAGMLVGAGMGMLFAPRRGSELRGQIGQRANRMAGRLKRQVRDMQGSHELEQDVRRAGTSPNTPGYLDVQEH
jgi:gas vesicle protein